MGLLVETAKFLEGEKNPSIKEISEFRTFLAEDIKSEISNILKNMRDFTAKRSEILANRAKMSKPAFTAAMSNINAQIAKLALMLKNLRGQTTQAGGMLSGAAQRAATAAKAAPPMAKAAMGAAAAGLGAYALYKHRKAMNAKKAMNAQNVA